jgi:hypothetical protein
LKAHLKVVDIPTDELMKLLVSIAKNLEEQQNLSCEVVTLYDIYNVYNKEPKEKRIEEKEKSEMSTAFTFFRRRVFGIKWTGAYQ